MKKIFTLVLFLFCTKIISAQTFIWDREHKCRMFINAPDSVSGNFYFLYTGNCVDGYLSGQNESKVYYKDKKTGTYTGNFVMGKINGQGKFEKDTIYSYVGEFKDGQYDGFGKSTTRNTNEYSGEFKNNMMEGKGTYTWMNRLNGRVYAKYDGEFSKGGFSGKGKYNKFADVGVQDIIYTVDLDLENGKSLGDATIKYLYWNDYQKIDKYVGQIKNMDVMYGKGIIYYHNGDRFEGELRNDSLTNGTMYFANDEKYIGEFQDQKSNGKGIYYYKNGDRFEGKFSEGKKDVELGVFYFAKGDRYEGNGKGTWSSEPGIIYYKSGTTEKGHLEENVFFKEGTTGREVDDVLSKPTFDDEREFKNRSDAINYLIETLVFFDVEDGQRYNYVNTNKDGIVFQIGNDNTNRVRMEWYGMSVSHTEANGVTKVTVSGKLYNMFVNVLKDAGRTTVTFTVNKNNLAKVLRAFNYKD